MQGNQQGKQLAAWIAIFAVLLAALAPAISQTIVSLRCSETLIEAELCSVKTDRSPDQVDLQAYSVHASHEHHDAPMSGDHGLHFEHCPFCFTHAGSFGALPLAEFILPLVAGSSVMPQLFLQSPHPLFIWTTAQARAPPFLC